MQLGIICGTDTVSLWPHLNSDKSFTLGILQYPVP